jgi:integrase
MSLGVTGQCDASSLPFHHNPKVVSEVVGHATLAITLDTYSHVLPNMQDSAARALEEALR